MDYIFKLEEELKLILSQRKEKELKENLVLKEFAKEYEHFLSEVLVLAQKMPYKEGLILSKIVEDDTVDQDELIVKNHKVFIPLVKHLCSNKTRAHLIRTVQKLNGIGNNRNSEVTLEIEKQLKILRLYIAVIEELRIKDSIVLMLFRRSLEVYSEVEKSSMNDEERKQVTPTLKENLTELALEINTSLETLDVGDSSEIKECNTIEDLLDLVVKKSREFERHELHLSYFCNLQNYVRFILFQTHFSLDNSSQLTIQPTINHPEIFRDSTAEDLFFDLFSTIFELKAVELGFVYFEYEGRGLFLSGLTQEKFESWSKGVFNYHFDRIATKKKSYSPNRMERFNMLYVIYYK